MIIAEEDESMKTRLAFAPGTLILWLFTHLAQTHGFDWTWHWFDLYLLLTWLVFAPMCVALLTQLKNESEQTVKARRNLYQQVAQNSKLYQDFVNGFGSGSSLWFESGSMDQIFQGVVHFGLSVIVQLLSPLLAVGLLLIAKPAK